MYWLPKRHKTPIGTRFILASNNCNTNPLPDITSKIFKMIFNTVESFHNKSLFYSSCKKFLIVQSSFPFMTKLNKIDVKKKAKSISTVDFSTLHITIPHKFLLKVLSEVIDFVFKSKVRKRIGLSKKSIYWTSKGNERGYFIKKTLANTVSFLINKCFFAIGNMAFKQDIVIRMGFDPAPFCTNFFLYFFESKYIKQIISNGSSKTDKYHQVSRFIDKHCAINDGTEFLISFKNIYLKELELKVKRYIVKQYTIYNFLQVYISRTVSNSKIYSEN